MGNSGGYSSPGQRRNGKRAGVDWNNCPLGEMMDDDIARILDLNHESVQSARVRRGISAYDQDSPDAWSWAQKQRSRHEAHRAR